MSTHTQVAPVAQPNTEVSGHIVITDGQPTTTTQDIADVYGKRHDNVLNIVRQRMTDAGEWGLLNFKETPYTNPQNGQTYSVIRMTKKGFHFVIGKFTGAKAVQHQIAFADEFERMESQLLEKREPLPKEPPKPSIETFQVKILTVFTRGDEPTQQVVPYGSCIIDPDNIVQLKTLINEEVPVGLMLDVINAASQKLARHIKHKN